MGMEMKRKVVGREATSLSLSSKADQEEGRTFVGSIQDWTRRVERRGNIGSD